MISLSTHLNDIKPSEDKPKSPPKTTTVETIKRRHSFNSMMKFLSSRKNLFTITESPIESSSFTAGASPQKPTLRKSRKGKKKTTVQKSLASALSIVAQRSSRSITKTDNYRHNPDISIIERTPSDNVTGTESLKDHSTVITVTTSQSLESSQNSINTCSTASLTDDDSESYHSRYQVKLQDDDAKSVGSSGSGKRRHSQSPKKKKKRTGTDLLTPTKQPPLVRGEFRWGEASKLDQQHNFGFVTQTRKRDVAPVCPVRTTD